MAVSAFPMDASSDSTPSGISSILLSWFYDHRRTLPWRKERTPYSTWISEAMLQQTRVPTVLNYYPRFLHRFPDPASLAEAPEDEVLKLWEGLGYYSRARNLMRGAKYICEHFHGELPSEPDLLLEIPGIGPYMAGAIASLAFDKPAPAVDGNCIRIYCRLHALPLIPAEGSTYKEIYSRILADIPEDAPGDFNEALMDLGSLICTPKSPKCETCPLNDQCSAFLLGKQEDFPLKKEKKATPIEEHTILKIFTGDKILVRKRPSTGLLAGLYELIDLPGNLTHAEVQTWLLENFPALASQCEFKSGSAPAASDTTKGFLLDESEPDIRPLGKSRHVFSHLRWEMIGYEIHLNAADKKTQKKLIANASKLGEIVSPKEYQALAFASALRAYR